MGCGDDGAWRQAAIMTLPQYCIYCKYLPTQREMKSRFAFFFFTPTTPLKWTARPAFAREASGFVARLPDGNLTTFSNCCSVSGKVAASWRRIKVSTTTQQHNGALGLLKTALSNFEYNDITHQMSDGLRKAWPKKKKKSKFFIN